MYVISLDHYLDAKGVIAIERGRGRKLADFATAAVAFAFSRHRPAGGTQLTCFKCRNTVDSAVDVNLTEAGLVIWRCRACGSEGQISSWRGNFWDLSGGALKK